MILSVRVLILVCTTLERIKFSLQTLVLLGLWPAGVDDLALAQFVKVERGHFLRKISH